MWRWICFIDFRKETFTNYPPKMLENYERSFLLTTYPNQNTNEHSFRFWLTQPAQKHNTSEPQKIPSVNPTPPRVWSIPNVKTEIIGNLTKKDNPAFLKQAVVETIQSDYQDLLLIYTHGFFNPTDCQLESNVWILERNYEFCISSYSGSSMEVELPVILTALQNIVQSWLQRRTASSPTLNHLFRRMLYTNQLHTSTR